MMALEDAGGSLLPALAWGRGAAEIVLKSLLTIGSLRLLTMIVHLVRTQSLAVILGPEWIGVIAVVDRLLGIVERRHHVIDVDVRKRITLRDVGEKLGIARSRRETAVSLEGLSEREKSPVFWVR